jgi:hypothetical protein
MKLNRNNYEEYFILYLDNELESDDRQEVEAFAEVNPDLKAELDMLLQSKLAPDTDITFNDKELLMIRNSSSISMANHEEWLLSYTDNELTEEERKDVEKFVVNNPFLQKELNLLQQVKLQPEAIVFPYKESLYRREEKAKVVAIRWWRMAAAAVLLLGISTTSIVLINNKAGKKLDGVAKIQPKEKIPAINTPVKQPENVIKGKEELIAANDQINKTKEIITPVAGGKSNPKSVEKKEQTVSVEKAKPVFAKNNNEKRLTNNLAQPTIENPYLKAIESEKTLATVVVPKNEPSLTKDKGNAHFASVTIDDPQPSYAIEQQSGGNKGLRGFFRKVTRTIEKRTNFNKAGDDDDRLLIAGLSIKTN